jgi:cytochrome c oxidase subunit 3
LSAANTTVQAVEPGGEGTSLGLPHVKVGFWTFIGSECMFFGSLLATYFAYRGKSLTGPFPHTMWVRPDGAHEAGILNVLVTSTSAFVLLFSSFAMVMGLHGVQTNNRKQARLWIFLTAVFGLIFLGFQSFEFTEFYHKGLSLSSNLFGSTFFVLTGFHGTHVAFGVLWLLTLFVTDLRRPIRPEESLKVEIAGLYWHFVDIVWIVIFTFVYLIPTVERFAS